MKYALVFGLILLVFFLWRSSRQSEAADEKKKSVRKTNIVLGKTTEIVACEVCRIHLPRDEAFAGKHGLYCSSAHKQQAGD